MEEDLPTLGDILAEALKAKFASIVPGERTMNPIDLIELDDMPGAKLTDEQRLSALNEVWELMSEDVRDILRCKWDRRHTTPSTQDVVENR